MIVLERRNKIKELLLAQGSVRVADMARLFAVSEETIRRDLGQLEDAGLAAKNYGGAMLVEEARLPLQPPVQQRKMQRLTEKDALGRRAREMVQPDQVVFLDAGSTTWCVARHLASVPQLRVITNGLTVAEELARSDNNDIFLIGGKLIKKSMSIVGPKAEAEIRQYSADVAFLGAAGISLAKGFTSSDIYEAEVKKAMVAAAQRVVVVADHTKFQRPGLIAFSDLKHVDTVITSTQADTALLAKLEDRGVSVIQVDVPREST